MENKCQCNKGKELYPHLFSPLRLGNIRMKNRIICAPTSPSMIDLNGHFTPEMRESLHTGKLSSIPLPESPTTSSCSWMPSACGKG